MKHIITKLFGFSLVVAAAASCDLFKIDNYDYPDTSIKGSIFDKDTRELVGTDVINGTTLSVIEVGNKVDVPMYFRVKNDGTYEFATFFSGKYRIQPMDRNFYQIDEREITLKKGDNVVDFEVVPYIRVKEAKIELNGTIVTGTFKLECPEGDSVKEIGIFESKDASVGSTIYDSKEVISVERLPGNDEVFTVVYDCASYKPFVKKNQSYFFRVGALSSFQGAKYNYAPAVRINVGSLTPAQ
ncbi:MAG: DUF3823 domain-containing protein [Bacteroidales bacterium]|nr:DUF3823 domain-containing protein [Bacteroidales bacterium]